MKVVLLIMAFAVLYINVSTWIYSTEGIKKLEDRVILPYSVIIFYTFLFVETEVLSLFSGLSTNSLLIVWSLFIITNLLVCLIRRKKLKWIGMKFRLIVNNKKEVLLYVVICVIIAITFYFAYRTVLYNWDSMTYHLPRVAHWAQNKSVSHFATDFYMQIKAPVFAEYIQLNVYLLAGGQDRYLNFMQCSAFLLSAVMIYHISIRIKCSSKWAVVAVIVFLSMPIAFAEAFTTQNDMITTLFLLCFVYFSLYHLQPFPDNHNRRVIDADYITNVLFLGAASGIAFLTKYYVAFPIVVMAGVIFFYYIRNKICIKDIIITVVLVGGIAFLFYLPEWIRLTNTYGGYGSGVTASGMLVNTMDPRLLFVNFWRNYTLNFSSHYIYNSNTIIDYAGVKIARLMGVVFNDARIGSEERWIGGAFTYSCDRAGGYIPAVLMVIALIVFIFKRKKKDQYDKYVVFAVLSMLILLTLMKSTPYRTRYELPFWAILCPACVFVIEKKIEKSAAKLAIQSVVVSLCLFEFLSLCSWQFYWIRDNQNGGMRPDGYFASYSKDSCLSYITLSNLIDIGSFKNIGLYVTPGLYEYPVWAMNPEVHIENVYISEPDDDHKAFIKYADTSYIPEAVIIIEPAFSYTEQFSYLNHIYNIQEQYEDSRAKYTFAVLCE